MPIWSQITNYSYQYHVNHQQIIKVVLVFIIELIDNHPLRLDIMYLPARRFRFSIYPQTTQT